MGRRSINQPRLGVRLFRRGLAEEAAKLSECPEDEGIRGPEGFQVILNFFDRKYESYLKIDDCEAFEDALNSPRESNDAFVALCARMTVEFCNLGKARGAELAPALQGELMLEMAQLTK